MTAARSRQDRRCAQLSGVGNLGPLLRSWPLPPSAHGQGQQAANVPWRLSSLKEGRFPVSRKELAPDKDVKGGEEDHPPTENLHQS